MSSSNPATDSVSPQADGKLGVITILVKNPTDRPGTPPFTLSLPYASTVAEVKDKLASTYPCNPAVNSQRLIYAGKLLHNSGNLTDIIPNADLSTVYTIHLVVSSRGAQSTSAQSTPLSHASGFASTAEQTGSNGFGTQPTTFPTQPPEAPFLYPMNMPPFPPGLLPSFPYPPFGAYVPPPSDNAATPGAPGGPFPPDVGNLPPMPPYPNFLNYAMAPAPHPNFDTAAYRAHLQTMERLIAESWQTHLNATAAAAAAHANAQNIPLAAQFQAQAAQLDAHAAALHAHAHAHARAHAINAAQHSHHDGSQPQPQPQPQPNIQANLPPQAGGPLPPVAGANFPNPNPPLVGIPGMPRVMLDFRMGRIGPNAAGGVPNPNDPRVRQFVLQFQINWVLLLKLAVFVYILGQDATVSRVMLLIAMAVVIYLWQMGHLQFFRRLIATVIPNPRQLMENLFPPMQRQRQQQPLPTRPQQQEGQDDSGEELPQRRATHRFGRVAIILSLFYSFVYGFVCSLLPAWNPEPHARIDELLQNAQPPQADEQARNVENHAHEHDD